MGILYRCSLIESTTSSTEQLTRHDFLNNIISVKVGGFRWNDWNLEHATKHGCTIDEIESAVRQEIRRAGKLGGGKWRVEGRGQRARFIESFSSLMGMKTTRCMSFTQCR
jgi:hypothetical protein